MPKQRTPRFGRYRPYLVICGARSSKEKSAMTADPSPLFSRSRRYAELVVASDALSGPEIEEVLGVKGDRVVTKGDPTALLHHVETDSAWLIRSTGITEDGGTVVSGRIDEHAPEEHHMDWLYSAVAPLEAKITSIPDAECVLRIVQRMEPEESQGRGVGLDRTWVQLLARLNGSFDVGQSIWI